MSPRRVPECKLSFKRNVLVLVFVVSCVHHVDDDDVRRAEAILDEANIAYELNAGLFAILRAPSQPPVSSSPAVSPLGESSTPTPTTEDTPPPELKTDLEAPTTSTYRVTTVLALIAALSLSHFILVAGGFTGEKGALKLEAVQRWFVSTFAPAS